jgi:hypothetical protein
LRSRHVKVPFPSHRLDPLTAVVKRTELLAKITDVCVDASVVGHDATSERVARDRILGDDLPGGLN